MPPPIRFADAYHGSPPHPHSAPLPAAHHPHRAYDFARTRTHSATPPGVPAFASDACDVSPTVYFGRYYPPPPVGVTGFPLHIPCNLPDHWAGPRSNQRPCSLNICRDDNPEGFMPDFFGVITFLRLYTFAVRLPASSDSDWTPNATARRALWHAPATAPPPPTRFPHLPAPLYVVLRTTANLQFWTVILH